MRGERERDPVPGSPSGNTSLDGAVNLAINLGGISLDRFWSWTLLCTQPDKPGETESTRDIGQSRACSAFHGNVVPLSRDPGLSPFFRCRGQNTWAELVGAVSHDQAGRVGGNQSLWQAAFCV